MNPMVTKFRSLVLPAFMAMAVLAAGCSGSNSSQQAAKGSAKVGVKVNALTATQIAKMTLVVTEGGNTVVTTNLTNNDLTSYLSWSGYVQGIPAGTATFAITAYDGSNNVLYSGSGTAAIVAGQTASVYIVLQGPNNGGFQNTLPQVELLTASTNTVTVGTTPPPAPVTLTFEANEPVAGNTMTYAWADTCGDTFTPASGSLASNTVTSVQWTPPTSVPASGACTLSLTISDNQQGSVTAYLSITIQSPSTGGVNVSAYPNTWPVITSLSAHETFTKNSSGQVIGVDIDLVANAVDADGDWLEYTWTSPNCNTPTASHAVGFTSSAVLTPTNTLALGPGAISSSTVHFTAPASTTACIVQVAVTDYWPNLIPPASSGLAPARGGDTIGLINASAPTDFQFAPQITQYSSPSAPVSGTVTSNSSSYTVQPGQQIQLSLSFVDPTPSFDPSGLPFTVLWQQNGGNLQYAPNGAPGQNTGSSPGFSQNVWTAASPTYIANSFVKVTVTNSQGLSASYTWNFLPANPCNGSNVGASCNTGLGLCAPNGQCTAQGTCVDPNAVVCNAPAQCQEAGVCNPSSGTCVYGDQPAGTACNFGTSPGCFTGSFCSAGACTAGTAVVCNTPTDTQCQAAIGTCNSTGNTTFTCSYTPVGNGTACNYGSAPGCLTGSACQNGACTAGTPVTCTQSANPCEASTGTCTSTGNTTFTCSYQPVANGSNCNTAGACISGQTCQAGACTGGSAACPANDDCTVSNNQAVCAATVVAPQVAKDLPVVGPVGLAIDSSANSYLVGSVTSTNPVSLDGHAVQSDGNSNLFVAAYNASGVAQWALGGIGDGTDPVYGVGAAVTNNGTVAAIGNFTGTFSINGGVGSCTGAGGTCLSSASAIDFFVAYNASSGAGLWANQFNDGANGKLTAVAANAGDSSAAHGNRIAVCGFANTTAPTNLVGASATAVPYNSIVVGVFNSSGAKIWASQFIATGVSNTSPASDCQAVAIDDNGDVFATGTLQGASLNFGGATLALTGPDSSLRKFVWVAKFNGTTGAAEYSAIFSGTAGSPVPSSLAVDATDNVNVAGEFTTNITFGSTTLTSAGGEDAFVAHLNSTLAPVWSVRLGGTIVDAANGVAVDSFGDVIAAGVFNKTATISGTFGTYGTNLVTTSTTSSNPFVLKINGTSGSIDFATSFADSATSSASGVAVNRYGSTTLNQISIAGTYVSTLTLPAPAGAITAVNATDVWLATAKLQ